MSVGVLTATEVLGIYAERDLPEFTFNDGCEAEVRKGANQKDIATLEVDWGDVQRGENVTHDDPKRAARNFLHAAIMYGRGVRDADGTAVAAREGTMVASSFHPELTDDTRFHEYFLDLVRRAKN